jgi:hypothetical protein
MAPLMLPWILRDRWSCFGLVVCGVLIAGLFAEMIVFSRYAAPLTELTDVHRVRVSAHWRHMSHKFHE